MSRTTGIVDFKNMKWVVNKVPVEGLSEDALGLPATEEMYNIQKGIDGSKVLYPKVDVDMSFNINFLLTSPTALKLYSEAKASFQSGKIKAYTLVGEAHGNRITIKDFIITGYPKAYFPDTKSEAKSVQFMCEATDFDVVLGSFDTITESVGADLLGGKIKTNIGDLF